MQQVFDYYVVHYDSMVHSLLTMVRLNHWHYLDQRQVSVPAYVILRVLYVVVLEVVMLPLLLLQRYHYHQRQKHYYSIQQNQVGKRSLSCCLVMNQQVPVYQQHCYH
jgi:hypothetical protein